MLINTLIVSNNYNSIMDILYSFIYKNLETKNIKFKSVKELFQSDDNKYKLTQNLYREVYLPNNQKLFNQIKQKVDKYVSIWAESGKLDKLEETVGYSINAPEEQLRYYNKLFIDTFKNVIVNYDTYNFEINNNPYKHILEYKINDKQINKKISDLLPNDFNYISFNNYNDQYNLNNNFKAKYNKIPYYERSIYRKNYDILDMGSFRERKLDNNNYKRYNNNELLNNVDYLRKK